jgi:hypothetical protein
MKVSILEEECLHRVWINRSLSGHHAIWHRIDVDIESSVSAYRVHVRVGPIFLHGGGVCGGPLGRRLQILHSYRRLRWLSAAAGKNVILVSNYALIHQN